MTACVGGIRAIRPGVSQCSVDAVVESACWKAGAHGASFWPWKWPEKTVYSAPFFFASSITITWTRTRARVTCQGCR